MNNNIEIKQITDKNQWETFLSSSKEASFYQSWASKTFFENMGKKVFSLGIFKNNNLVGIALVTKEPAKRGPYLYCPHGPVLQDFQDEQVFNEFIKYLKILANQEKVWYIKIPPYLEDTQTAKELFQKNNFRPSVLHSLVEESWLLDLNKSEEDLLSGMRKTTRNLIRRGIKEKVKVTKSKALEDLRIFYKIYIETSKRHKFIPYSKKFVTEQIKPFLENDEVLIFLGEHNNKIIVSSIIFFYGNQGIYYHGASEYSKIPVSYLVQWEAIKEAKKRGCKLYNFWGIYTGENRNHPFKGITHFKTGFGGYKKNILPCHDLPLTKKYKLTYLFERIRKVKRGF